MVDVPAVGLTIVSRAGRARGPDLLIRAQGP
jgi:hypothetical protein